MKIQKKETLKLVNSSDIVSKYKLKENTNRIISYCGGGFGIEILQKNIYQTLYINRFGEEEFTIKKRCPVLPMDQILFTAEALNYNDIQDNLLKNYRKLSKKIIKRKGDENIILISKKDEKVLSINRNGWVLEFRNKAIYSKDEIIFEDIKNKDKEKNLSKGDECVVTYDMEKYKGKIRSRHELYDAYSIDFNKNGIMYNTTFHSSQVEVV